MSPKDSGATDVLAHLSFSTILLIAAGLTVLRMILLSLDKSSKPDPTKGSGARMLAEICESLAQVGVLVFLLIRPYVVQAFYIPSPSMERTLLGHDAGPSPYSNEVYKHTVHDHIFVDKFIYLHSNPQHGDIVVFRAPPKAMPGSSPTDRTFIKRCIGIPGDTIQIVEQNGEDYVERNGVVLHEYHNPKLDYSIHKPMDPSLNDSFHYAYPAPLHLGKNQYFVMGDNRNESNDSRYWGTVSRWRFIGKAEVIFWPLDRIRFLH